MCPAPAAPCDNFTLHVNTPAGYGTGHSMNVAVSWPNPAADFDLYLLPEADVAGRQVGVTRQPVKIGERRMRLLARVPVTYIPFVVREGSDFSWGRRTLAGGGVDVTSIMLRA